MADRLFTIHQVADLLGSSPLEVMGWINKGWLSCRRSEGRGPQVPEKSLIEFLKKQGVDIEAVLAKAVLADPQAGETPGDIHPTITVPAARLGSLRSAAADLAPSVFNATSRTEQGALPAPPPPRSNSSAEVPIDDLDSPLDDGPRDDSMVGRSPAVEPASVSASPAEPVAQVADAILRDAADRGATAIHLEPTAAGLGLRLRVDGVLYDKVNFRLRLPPALAPGLLAHFRSLAGAATVADEPAMARFERTLSGRQFEFQLAPCPTAAGEKLVIHVRDIDQPPRRLSDLGLDSAQDPLIRHMLRRRSGLIVLAGLSRSGAGTTLRALLGSLDGRAKNLILIDRQFERMAPNVTHILAGGDGALAAGDALAAALGQDPDVIALGEVTDLATLKAATAAARERCLMLVRLHVPSVDAAWRLLAETGVEAWPLAQSLLAVIAQSTVRRLCPQCKRRQDPPAELLAQIGPDAGGLSPAFAPSACGQCHNSGYAGRTGVFSFLRVDETLSTAIRQGAQADSLLALAGQAGMKTILQAGLDKVRLGETSLQEVAAMAEPEAVRE